MEFGAGTQAPHTVRATDAEINGNKGEVIRATEFSRRSFGGVFGMCDHLFTTSNTEIHLRDKIGAGLVPDVNVGEFGRTARAPGAKIGPRGVKKAL